MIHGDKMNTAYANLLKYSRDNINYDEIYNDVIKPSVESGFPPIHIDVISASMMKLIVTLIKPKFIVEIGTLYGFSSIVLSSGLTEEAKLITVDIDPNSTAAANRFFSQLKINNKVSAICDDAINYLEGLDDDSIDLLFIDGEKKSYPAYLKAGFCKLKKGGVIIMDDAAASADYSVSDFDYNEIESINEILKYNNAVFNSSRIYSAFVPTEHGLVMSVKL